MLLCGLSWTYWEIYPASSCLTLYLSVEDYWYNAIANMIILYVYGALIIHLLHFWFERYGSFSLSPSLHIKLNIYSPMELIQFQISALCIHFMPFVCGNDLEYSGAESLLKRLWWLCRTGFDFRSVSMGFVVDRVALGQVSFVSSTFVLLSL